MPGQLLPLRLLNSSISTRGFTSVKQGATNLHDISVFSKVFPFRMKFMGLSRNLRVPISMVDGSSGGERLFSSGSFRPRSGGRSNSEFLRSRGAERGGFEAGSVGKRSGVQSKSLIEDEAELSDWVSDLKPDSFRVSLNSDSDGSDGDNGRNRDRGDRGNGRGRGRGRGSFSDSRGGRGGGRDGFVAPKRREYGSDDFGRMSSRGDTRGSFSRNSRGSMSGSGRRLPSGSDSDDIRESYPRRREQGSRGGLSSPSSRGGRNSSFNSRGGGSFQKGPKAFDLPSRKRGSEDDSDDDEVALGGLLRGAVRDGGRASGSQPRKLSGKPAFLSTDDEDDDDDDDDDDEEDEEDEDDVSEARGQISEHSEDSDEDTDEEEISLNGSAKVNGEKPVPKLSTGETLSYLSKTRFDQCSISPLSMKGVKDAGYEHMTVVQEATLPIILKGKDVLAKARTGTGKTVAFLLPAIEAIVKSPSVDRDQRKPPINVLVICPTRELASQAAAEANKLLKYHPSIGVQVVIGGVRLALEQKRLQANPCQILIATPGRLRDHTENTASFATRLMGVKVLVLDEADHLLDMGFRKDIEKIIASVPKQRQTLLFSATVPEEVRQVCHIALKRDHEYINTVEEGSEETHAQVKQMHLVAPLDKHFSLLYALLKEHIADDVDYKVLVFCTTAMVTRLVANLLSELNMNVREIHSRKPQSYRTRVSDEFRKSKGLILVTSDVSARGVDYPDVTLVIQVGLPADREQYIHRLGRTGRKGKEGEGILLLAPWEEFFLSKLRDLPLTKASVPSVDPDTRKKVERALSQVEMKNKEAAYQAWLGFYNSNKTVARDKSHLVELANEFSRSMGLDNPPAISKLVLGKMGLKNVPGLRIK